MIIRATIPLLLEHGVGVTSRQIAEAAGVAEGTIFRAFGDKESLVNAAVTAFMDGTDEPHIDSELPLDEKLRLLVEGMRHRVHDVMRMAAVTGRRPTPSPAQRAKFTAWVASVFDRDRAALRIDLDEFADYVRILAIATSIPIEGKELTTDDILGFLKHGVLKDKD